MARRIVPLVLAACAALVVGGLPPAQAAPAAERAALPEKVVVNDGRTSDPNVDIARVTLEASWYWDSEQYVRIKVPNGFRPGQRLTVWFDNDGDASPEGHYELRTAEPKKQGGKYLRLEQEFRLGGGWSHGGELVRCTGSEGFRPVIELKRGQRNLVLAMDLWWCLKTPNPPGLDQGAWRAAVRLAKGSKADMAPNGRRWSKQVAGWGPCDPSGGDCP